MPYNYQTEDGEKFLRELPARQHVVDLKDISHSEAEQYVEEITETEKEDEETLGVYNFTIVRHYTAEKRVQVEATNKEEAEERAEEELFAADPVIVESLHEDIDKGSKVDEVPRSKIESGEYYEGDSE